MPEFIKSFKILLCSPREGSGGISMWTKNILEYYQSIPIPDISLKWSYPTLQKKEILADTPLLLRIYYGLRNYIPLLWLLRKEMKTEKYNLVHFTSSASISLLKDIISIRIAHKYGVKAIIHFHFGRIPQIMSMNNWESKLIKRVIRLADGIIVLDQASYDVLLNYGCNSIYKLANPLALATQNYIKKHQRIQRQSNEVLFVGHLVESKGIFELLLALENLGDIKVNIIGKGTPETLNKLKKESLRLGISEINFLGVQPIESVIKYMKSCSVFVLPTYTEGFPYVIIESMACGCPIVTTDVGAIPEMLDIENGNNYGICVQPKQVAELKNAILFMLTNKEYAYTCGKNAQNRVEEQYSIHKVWDKMSSIWKETIFRLS